MKSEAAFQTSETPPLRAEVPPLHPETGPLQEENQNFRTFSSFGRNILRLKSKVARQGERSEATVGASAPFKPPYIPV